MDWPGSLVVAAVAESAAASAWQRPWQGHSVCHTLRSGCAEYWRIIAHDREQSQAVFVYCSVEVVLLAARSLAAFQKVLEEEALLLCTPGLPAVLPQGVVCHPQRQQIPLVFVSCLLPVLVVVSRLPVAQLSVPLVDGALASRRWEYGIEVALPG